MEHRIVLVIDLDGRQTLERLQEADLRTRPRRLLAPVAVREQVDVVGVCVGSQVELVSPLVDVTDRCVDFSVPRGRRNGRERLVQRLGQAILRGERPRHAESCTRRLGIHDLGVAVRLIGLIEQTRRPERVAIQCQGFGIRREIGHKPVGFLLRHHELRDPEGRSHLPFASTVRQLGVFGHRSRVERHQRFRVPSLLEEEVGKLDLHLGIGVGDVCPQQQRAEGHHHSGQSQSKDHSHNTLPWVV